MALYLNGIAHTTANLTKALFITTQPYSTISRVAQKHIFAVENGLPNVTDHGKYHSYTTSISTDEKSTNYLDGRTSERNFNYSNQPEPLPPLT